MHKLDYVDASILTKFSIGAHDFFIQQDVENPKYFWVNVNSNDEIHTVLQFYRHTGASGYDVFTVEDQDKQLGFVECQGGSEWVLHTTPLMTRRVVSHNPSYLDAMTAVAMNLLSK